MKMTPEPYICEPEDKSAGRPASYIFLHGYGDDAEGLPLALAQQFQWYHKMQYLRWVLPNAGRHQDAMENAWYMPKALPNAMKPRVPGREEDSETALDDEAGILKACDSIDELVRAELDRGVEPGRIVVGGFSQGCAVSLVWGLVGKERKNVSAVLPLSGYFPLADRLGTIRKERGISETPTKDEEKLQWFYVHGDRDLLVPLSIFNRGKEALYKWVHENDVEEHVYPGMGHTTAPAELKHMLAFLTRVIPP